MGELLKHNMIKARDLHHIVILLVKYFKKGDDPAFLRELCKRLVFMCQEYSSGLRQDKQDIEISTDKHIELFSALSEK